MIRPALLYEVECWALKKVLALRLEVAKIRMLALYLWSNMLDRLLIDFFTRQLRVISIIEKVREGRL